MDKNAVFGNVTIIAVAAIIAVYKYKVAKLQH